jgi:lactoylglutathione lyase
MVRARDLFEGHLTVSDLRRSMAFYRDVVGLELAHFVAERRAAFYWIGGRGESMLGLWEAGTPQRLNLHLAFKTDLDDLLQAPAQLRAAGVTPRDFSGNPTDEPVVLAWMPAASLYFNDPDGNLLEYLSMLQEPPEPASGIVGWARWTHRHDLHRSEMNPLVPE